MHADVVMVVAQMQNHALSHNLTPFISMQNHYNAVYREEEREMIPTLKVCIETVHSVDHTDVIRPALWSRIDPLVSTGSWNTCTPMEHGQLRPEGEGYGLCEL